MLGRQEASLHIRYVEAVFDANSVLFSVNSWFDFGALPGFAAVELPCTLILDQTSAPLDDVAKWYGGYFDAVLLKSRLDSTLLRQFLPLQLLLTVGERKENDF